MPRSSLVLPQFAQVANFTKKILFLLWDELSLVDDLDDVILSILYSDARVTGLSEDRVVELEFPEELVFAVELVDDAESAQEREPSFKLVHRFSQ